MSPRKNRLRTFHIVSLGCPKNRVDAEVIWAEAAISGLTAVDDPAQADVIIVNTCGFIQSAVTESIDTILTLSQHKVQGRCQRLVVAGCLAGRYGKDLVEQFPEVDLFLTPGEVAGVKALLNPAPGASIRKSAAKARAFLPSASTPRVNSLSPGSAYLKVAEGCNRRCSFCIIPHIRGRQRSRTITDLVKDAKNLTRSGIREVILVAQDLASWGKDLPGNPTLDQLVRALAAVPSLAWLRLMYLFPQSVDGRLVRVLGDHPNVLPYLDIPIQHVNRAVLKGMRRSGDPATLARLVRRLREELPGLVLRTSLMTGFPGETEAAYQELRDFVQASRFERLGVFAFSPEEGTAAARMPDQVPTRVAKARMRGILLLQKKISLAFHRSLLGTTVSVIVEGKTGDGVYVGRTWNQAPEVDGVTYVLPLTRSGRARKLPIGQIVEVRVTQVQAYDLMAEPI